MAVLAPTPPVNVPPGSDETPISYLRERERPIWSRGGTLIKRPPVRHYIPRHNFYYTSNELFESQNKNQAAYEQDTKKFVAKTSDTDPRRAFSAPVSRVNELKEENVKLKSQSPNLQRPKTSRASIGNPRPEMVSWVSTPVPGIRTIEKYDLYRQAALSKKNHPVYHIKSGLLPKYMGYVPGLKFRYGSTFGMLTYNAKEIGTNTSLTWGGAVSLF